MKKFVGIVNGKSFDNEKDFNDASLKALGSGEDTLSITSYYSYVADDANKEIEESDDAEGSYLDRDEYLIKDLKPIVLDNGNYEYELPSDVEEKIRNASNKDEIKDVSSMIIGNVSNDIAEFESKNKKIEIEIERLQDELYGNEEDLKELKARKRYFNTIVDIIDEPEDEDGSCQSESEPEDKKNDRCCIVPLGFFDALLFPFLF